MLTFDDGPHAKYTSHILDILKEKKVKATFFVVGSKAMHHPEILKRMQIEKHDVGNRGWMSMPIVKVDLEQLSLQIKSTSRIISNATSTEVKYFRPPSGLTNMHINSHIKDKEKLKTILWSLDSKDIEANISAEKIKEYVVTKAKPGDVVWLHDTVSATVTALPGIIDALYAQGYEFLTLSQVISFPDDSPH